MSALAEPAMTVHVNMVSLSIIPRSGTLTLTWFLLLLLSMLTFRRRGTCVCIRFEVFVPMSVQELVCCHTDDKHLKQFLNLSIIMKYNYFKAELRRNIPIFKCQILSHLRAIRSELSNQTCLLL